MKLYVRNACAHAVAGYVGHAAHPGQRGFLAVRICECVCVCF